MPRSNLPGDVIIPDLRRSLDTSIIAQTQSNGANQVGTNNLSSSTSLAWIIFLMCSFFYKGLFERNCSFINYNLSMFRRKATSTNYLVRMSLYPWVPRLSLFGALIHLTWFLSGWWRDIPFGWRRKQQWRRRCHSGQYLGEDIDVYSDLMLPYFLNRKVFDGEVMLRDIWWRGGYYSCL